MRHTKSGVRVADASTREVEWLWRGWIPRGKVTVVESDPNLGKSLFTIDVASRVSTGASMPDGTPGVRGDVEFFCAEDDLEDTVRPRLQAAGANLNRIRYSNDFNFEKLRERLLASPSTVLVVIDPFSYFMMKKGMDSKDENQVRSALEPLINLAQERGIAIVVVRHWNKSETGKALYKGSGSIAITAAARSTLMVAPMPGDEDIKVLASVKSNLARRPESLKYEIADTESGWPQVVWLGPTHLTANELADNEQRLTKVKLAAQYIRGLLSRGDMSSVDFEQSMAASGFATRTTERARREADVHAYQKGGIWYVSLNVPSLDNQFQTATSPESQAA